MSDTVLMWCVEQLCGGDDRCPPTNDWHALPAIHQPLRHAARPVRLPHGNPYHYQGAGNEQCVSVGLEWNDPLTELVSSYNVTLKFILLTTAVSKASVGTGSDRKEDPAIPGYVQLRRIWSHWILASRLLGRRQPAGRPGDQWWTWQCSRRVCHEKKKK